MILLDAQVMLIFQSPKLSKTSIGMDRLIDLLTMRIRMGYGGGTRGALLISITTNESIK